MLLETQNLTKKFGGLVAINNLSFGVEEGEILGIMGPNGAGKTTLFNTICGVYAPTEGKVLFHGKDISRLKPYDVCKSGIARTFQLANCFNRINVLDNVVCGAIFSSGQ